jgi:predicted glycoside hydrolase/deacetylase ChbG (UPF0249 family)
MVSGGTSDRWLVLHADDYGMNAAVNAGILQAFREGILTSTSLLANAPGAIEACEAWPRLIQDLKAGAVRSVQLRRQLGDDLHAFDLGIHLNLTQGRPLSAGYPAELLSPSGSFPGIGTVFRRLRSASPRFQSAVQSELQLQIERMLDCGIQPTHLNGHQYIEMIPGVARLIPDLMRKYSIPVVRVALETHLHRTVLGKGRLAPFLVGLVKQHFARRFRRLCRREHLPHPDAFFGTAHAGLVSRDILQQFLSGSRINRLTEVGLHPAQAPGGKKCSPSDDWYDPLDDSRPAELDWLCDPATVELISSAHVRLGRLSQLGTAR